MSYKLAQLATFAELTRDRKKERHLGVLKERGEYVYYVRHLRTLILILRVILMETGSFPKLN